MQCKWVYCTLLLCPIMQYCTLYLPKKLNIQYIDIMHKNIQLAKLLYCTYIHAHYSSNLRIAGQLSICTILISCEMISNMYLSQHKWCNGINMESVSHVRPLNHIDASGSGGNSCIVNEEVQPIGSNHLLNMSNKRIIACFVSHICNHIFKGNNYWNWRVKKKKYVLGIWKLKLHFAIGTLNM